MPIENIGRGSGAGRPAAKPPATKNPSLPAWQQAAIWSRTTPAYGPGSAPNYITPLSISDSVYTPTGGGDRGVTRGLFGGAKFGGGPGVAQPAEEAQPGILDLIRRQYGGLENQLMELSRQYATGINESTGSTARMLQSVDPTAAYRITAPSLAAPPAAATSYLNAIGANPAQVQAQQDYLNQMMQSQAGSQSDYQRAVDQANAAYREAQISELYRNAAEAQAGLGAATQGQVAALGMQRLKDEQAIINALLEYQLAAMKESGGGGGRGNAGAGLPFPNLGSIRF